MNLSYSLLGMPFQTPQIKGDDLNNIELVLDGPPIPDYLAVFIRDPENKDQYWLREIGVECSSIETGELNGAESPYINLKILNLDEKTATPYPEASLSDAGARISQYEQSIKCDSDPKMKKISAVVGVAEYEGDNPPSFDNIVTLVGLKYYQKKASYDKSILSRFLLELQPVA